LIKSHLHLLCIIFDEGMWYFAPTLNLSTENLALISTFSILALLQSNGFFCQASCGIE